MPETKTNEIAKVVLIVDSGTMAKTLRVLALLDNAGLENDQVEVQFDAYDVNADKGYYKNGSKMDLKMALKRHNVEVVIQVMGDDDYIVKSLSTVLKGMGVKVYCPGFYPFLVINDQYHPDTPDTPDAD